MVWFQWDSEAEGWGHPRHLCLSEAGGKQRGVAGVKPGVGAGAAQDSSQVSGWTPLAEAPALTMLDAELGRTSLEPKMDRQHCGGGLETFTARR